MEELASGFKWRLSKSDRAYFVLELLSPYGTVELKLKGVYERGIGYDILRTYEDLKASGPVEVESEQVL